MGEVWAARNELTQRNFAIKFMLPALAQQPEALERFIREAETAGSLQHPSIVDVYDVAQAEDGQPYIVMELLSGETLDTRLEREGTLSALRTAAYMGQVAQALDLAHGAGIVHRDLSTANIFMARNPEGGEPIPKILDFGVSKTVGTAAPRWQTAAGAVLGCPDFMSPEQACGAETVDARTDIWSLGVVMYQCLAGTIPFRASNYNAQMVAIMTRAHRALREVAPGVDAELSALVESCLAKEREHRVQSARELAERLSAIARRLAEKSPGALLAPRRRATDRLRGRPVANVELPLGMLPLPVRSYRWLSSIRPSRGVVGVVSLIIGALAGGAAAGGWERIVAPPPAPVRIEGAIVPSAAARSASAAVAPKSLAVASRTKSPARAP